MKPGATVRPSKRAKYDEVVAMDSTIVTYRDEYAKDLSRRLGITAEELPAAYAIATLLNPMFGRKPNIVGSGLMTEKQYAKGRDSLLV